MAKQVKVGNHKLRMPGSRRARTALGVGLVIGGLLGFLPVLGFWMIPLGLLVLSIDSPYVRRWRRRMEVRWGPWLKRKHPRIAKLLGLGNGEKPGQRPAG